MIALLYLTKEDWENDAGGIDVEEWEANQGAIWVQSSVGRLTFGPGAWFALEEK